MCIHHPIFHSISFHTKVSFLSSSSNRSKFHGDKKPMVHQSIHKDLSQPCSLSRPYHWIHIQTLKKTQLNTWTKTLIKYSINITSIFSSLPTISLARLMRIGLILDRCSRCNREQLNKRPEVPLLLEGSSKPWPRKSGPKWLQSSSRHINREMLNSSSSSRWQLNGGLKCPQINKTNTKCKCNSNSNSNNRHSKYLKLTISEIL